MTIRLAITYSPPSRWFYNINKFATLSRYVKGGTVTFGDDSKGTIIGIGNIKIGTSSLIENVVLIDGLKHNLLSISQLCDRGSKVVYDESSCNIYDYKTNECILTGFRENNVYIIDILCHNALSNHYQGTTAPYVLES